MLALCLLLLVAACRADDDIVQDEYFQYVNVPAEHEYEFGYHRGNPSHHEGRYEQRTRNGRFTTKVKWANEYEGYGQHLWEYNHYPDGYNAEYKPQYEAPKYKAPKYEAPKYEAPKYEIPKYEIPKYEAPKYETTADYYEAPKYEAPKYETPRYEAPKYEAPKYEASKYDTPADYYEAPQYETPKYEAPTYDAPRYEAPKYETPIYGTPKSQAPKYQLPKYVPRSARPASEQTTNYEAAAEYKAQVLESESPKLKYKTTTFSSPSIKGYRTTGIYKDLPEEPQIYRPSTYKSDFFRAK